MRTLRFAKEERKSERERERAREKELEHRPKRVVHLEKKGRHTKSQIFWFWTLEEREREIASKPIAFVRTVYFPDRMTTCKRLLMPSCVFFDESFDILKRLTRYLIMQSVCVCVCDKLAFLSSDAANFF